jgi:hypothetical protein
MGWQLSTGPPGRGQLRDLQRVKMSTLCWSCMTHSSAVLCCAAPAGCHTGQPLHGILPDDVSSHGGGYNCTSEAKVKEPLEMSEYKHYVSVLLYCYKLDVSYCCCV